MSTANHSPRPPALDPPTAAATPETRLTLREYVRQKVDGHNLTTLAKKSGIPYATLRRHCAEGQAMSAQTAVDLQAWSENRKRSSVTIDAAMTAVDGVKPRRRKS